MILATKYFVLAVLLNMVVNPGAGWTYFNLPPLPTADQYGDIVLNNRAQANGQQAVVFSHWSHRARYTCRVCHFELNFALVAGQTEISAADIKDGEFCGACHNGKIAFGCAKKGCDKCHTGAPINRSEQFALLDDKLAKPPWVYFGNQINWVRAQQSGDITPQYSLFRPDEKPLSFNTRLELAAEWSWVPPAIFDHSTHIPWLDCANCHPEIFNIKKKTTKHFRMEYILEKKFCGVCHFAVAQPIDDCHACHPGMRHHQ